jgi:hypothetical protein
MKEEFMKTEKNHPTRSLGDALATDHGQQLWDTLVALNKWCNSQIKPPLNRTYCKGYNDAVLDFKNAIKRNLLQAGK